MHPLAADGLLNTHSLRRGKQASNCATYGVNGIIKRPTSQQWQCRFKLPTGQWHVATTGTDQVEQAKQQAILIYETIRVRIALDLSAKTKTFKMLALEEMENMRQLMENKQGKRTYQDYAFAINRDFPLARNQVE